MLSFASYGGTRRGCLPRSCAGVAEPCQPHASTLHAVVRIPWRGHPGQLASCSRVLSGNACSRLIYRPSDDHFSSCFRTSRVIPSTYSRPALVVHSLVSCTGSSLHMSWERLDARHRGGDTVPVRCWVTASPRVVRTPIAGRGRNSSWRATVHCGLFGVVVPWNRQQDNDNPDEPVHSGPSFATLRTFRLRHLSSDEP